MTEEKGVKINNTQRREFAKIADNIIADKLRVAMEEEAHQRCSAKQQAAKELGVDELERQIDALDRQIQLLQERREQRGFSKYDHIIPGSKADRIIQSYMDEVKSEEGKLKVIRNNISQRIWASQTVEEAASVLEEVRKL